MPTYREIQDYVKTKYHRSVETCHIAHVKELRGVSMRPAPNRVSNSDRVKPCPADLRPLIEDALRVLGEAPDSDL
jgi:hypothetical protein